MTGTRDYYNELDPFAAQWIREMIGLGVLPPGEVDQRSIKDVTPHDLEGFRHCHFFAGVGGWAYAAKLAEWPDDLRLWTGSCPCQPFSTAGEGRGHDDPRDLWPHFFRLIRARRPAHVVGEQVAGKAGLGWLDRVRADLARQDYASRGVDIPACAVDAPNIRSRLYWRAMADAQRLGLGGRPGQPCGDVADGPQARRPQGADGPAERHGGGLADRPMVDAARDRWGEGRAERRVRGRGNASADAAPSRDLADAGRERRRTGLRSGSRHVDMGDAAGQGQQGLSVAERFERLAGWRPDAERAGRRTWRSHWADAVWIICHDGKARRAEPSIPLLAHGVHARVPKWRGFGNAINPILAAEVLGALLDDLGADRAGMAVE
jgi:DNA (cytosine-5)-methyltransferase 1